MRYCTVRYCTPVSGRKRYHASRREPTFELSVAQGAATVGVSKVHPLVNGPSVVLC